MALKETVHFCLCIAGTVFDVTCLYESTLRYCAGFLTRDPADHTIVITREDLDREGALMCNTRSDDGTPIHPTLQMLEVSALCRQIAQLMPQSNCVLFHGSGLALDGQGVLFTAKSGTGKSTHTRLWREVFGQRVTMVNDDKPFLRIEKEGVTLCGSPWMGKHRLGQNISVPLKAVCILCRGEENRIESISARDALPTLLQQTFSPEDPDALLKTIALAGQLSKGVSMYRLYCNMDPQAAITAKNGIDF